MCLYSICILYDLAGSKKDAKANCCIQILEAVENGTLQTARCVAVSLVKTSL